MGKLLEDLKQLIVFSKEFRIAAPRWWNLTNAMTIEHMIEVMQAPKQEQTAGPENDKKMQGLMAEMATTLWRLQHRVNTTVDLPQEIRKIVRDIEAMEEALEQANIEINDPCGQPYADGMALQVLARQQTPGLISEIVIETIKPTVFHAGNLIQRGEVIVGIPERNLPDIRNKLMGTSKE